MSILKKSRVAVVNYFSKNFVEERMTAIMETKKYTLPVMIITFMLVFGAATAFAVASSASEKRVGEDTAPGLCNVAGCNMAEVHQHGNEHYAGHSVGDGHGYHAVCNVEGCTQIAKHEHQSTASSISDTAPGLCNVAGCNMVEVHQHGNEHYAGHSVGDGHGYHVVCNVEGCTQIAKHEHQSTTSSSNGNGHHNSGHSRGGHH